MVVPNTPQVGREKAGRCLWMAFRELRSIEHDRRLLARVDIADALPAHRRPKLDRRGGMWLVDHSHVDGAVGKGDWGIVGRDGNYIDVAHREPARGQHAPQRPTQTGAEARRSDTQPAKVRI